MEQVFISFNVTNFLTIAIMAVMIWFLLSLLMQAYKNFMGAR